MRFLLRFATLLLVFVLLSIVSPALPTYAQSTQSTYLYTFPAADVVYPEGIAYHAGNGDFFVGSTVAGAVYRGNAWGSNRQLSLFLPPGSDGRTDVRGMKVNPQGQLFMAGGATGTMWMYDAVTGRFLSTFSTGLPNSLINDVAIGPDGAAYFTDSNNPILFRIKPDAQGVFQLEFWRDLRDTPIQYTTGFNLNGIAVTTDGKYVITVQSNTGKLFRIATDTKEVSEIKLAGGDLMTNGDGILVDGQTLYVSRNSLNLMVQVSLAPDFATGQQVGSFTDPLFAYTTTMAKAGDRLLVVNSQFNRRMTSNPVLPFTIASVRVP